MIVDWPILTLGDVCDKITDGAHNSPKSVEDGKPMASVKDLTRFGVNLSEARLIPQEDYDKLVKQGCQPEVGDVLIAKDGNSALDTVCTVDKPLDAVMLSSVAILRPNKEKLDSDFLKYYFCSKDVIDYLKSNFISGAAIPRVVLKDFRKATIKTPPIEKQREISRVLRSLDDKIELNRQTNQTLEQIAQAIFKSWFVDFEPVKAKIAAKQTGATAEQIERAAMCAISGKTLEQLEQLSLDTLQQLKSIAALFPDALVDSELGEIPEGWEVKTFGDVSQCFDSKRVPLSKKQREEKKPGNIPYYGATSIMDYVNEWIFDDIYLLLGEDGSVIKENGTPFIQYIWGKAWVNNHAHVLQGKNGVSTEQLMIFIQSQNIAAYITGAVQLKLNQGNMNSIPFLDSGEVINLRFYDLIKPLYEKMRNIYEENKALAITRDTLLPKLLSGEIVLSNNEHMEVAAND
ncbi:MAG: restriction endonuclease subunit S [Gammaproteobacteria bacterium]|nr:restriction endonuclease subunit S [Gammaproteobacteria bacterium]